MWSSLVRNVFISAVHIMFFVSVEIVDFKIFLYGFSWSRNQRLNSRNIIKQSQRNRSICSSDLRLATNSASHFYILELFHPRIMHVLNRAVCKPICVSVQPTREMKIRLERNRLLENETIIRQFRQIRIVLRLVCR